ncbi:hypothetical protein [Streptomyces sp. 8N706]|uniref:hypothetical protein n=1 Tax=Streptomyces sp. 8N706 TaxID=3457416 RepID=UPI003FD28E6C
MSTEHSPEGTPEDRTPENPRHRRSTLVAVSVAAAVLLAGGGGAYWASTASDGGGDGTPAAGQGDPPPLKLDGYGTGGSGSAGPDEGIAPGEPDPSGARYRAKGSLPDGPDSAHVYRAQGEVSRERAQRLAKALDVPGAPRLVDDTWKFGLTRDASGPTLDVQKKAPGTWTYVRYGKGGAGGCTEPPMSGPKDQKGGTSSSASDARCPAPGDLSQEPKDGEGDGAGPVSEREAKKAAGPALKSIGLSDAKLDASRTMGALRLVNADPVFEGLPTYGWHTGLQVGSDGQVAGGSGHLTELTKGPDYPVLGAEETLKELNKSSGGDRVGIDGCASAAPDHGAVGIEGGDAPKDSGPDSEQRRGDQPGAEACASAGGTTSQTQTAPKSEPMTVRDAVFGLAIHFVAGKQALVPSWMFEVEQPGATGPRSTYTVTHPAVQPKYIARSTPGGTPPTSSPEKPGGAAKTRTHIESYSVDGRTLTLHFWGGVCSNYSASADASDGTVKAQVTGVEKKPGKVCIKIAKQFEKKVTLDEPLGDREVVDASTGRDVPKKK